MRKRASLRKLKARFLNGGWLTFVDLVDRRLDVWVAKFPVEMASSAAMVRLRRS